MAGGDKSIRPIVIIKKKISHDGRHGGAWKVAYADFVTAMMSLFIVLWLLNSTPQIKQAVAGYFNDPRSSGKETGTKTLGAGESISIDKQNVEKLKEEIEKAILKQADLNKLSKQIEITVTGEGLKIELIEDKGGTFFETGSQKLSQNGVSLLGMLSGQLKVLPNRLLIEGHTDAQPFSSDRGYTNWELSSDRANSARRVLQQGGVGPNQISQIRGYADQSLRVPSNPLDASNRRISLIVQWADAGAHPADAETPTQPREANNQAAEAVTKPHAGREQKPDNLNPEAAGEPMLHPQPQGTGSTEQGKQLPMKSAATTSRPSWTERMKTLIPGKKRQP